MVSPADVIRRLGGASAVANALGIANPSTVAKWAARQSIPARYWLALLELAAKRGERDITAEALACAHSAEAV